MMKRKKLGKLQRAASYTDAKTRRQSCEVLDIVIAAKGDLLCNIHLVGWLFLFLSGSGSRQDSSVSTNLRDGEVNTCVIQLRTIQTNLPNQIEEVTLRVRTICRCSLVGLVECRDS